MPLLAVLAAVLSVDAAGRGFGALGAGGTVALALVAAAFGRFPLVLGPRTMYALETPTVLLAGMLGGPLAGAVVGASGGMGDMGAVWRRRAAYTGIGALQGIAAGHAGLAWRDGHIQVVTAAALGAAGAVALGLAGLALVQLDRRAFSPARLLRSASMDAVGLALALPPVALMAVSFDARPILVLAATTCIATAAIVAARFGAEREVVAAERQEALLRDWLTGAASRALFELELERTREAVLRGARPAGLLIVDADHFKEINDTFGHATGDGVLCELVRRIEDASRAGDLVARWGGEEFCVLAPAIATAEELAALADRILAAVSEAPFTVAGTSIGITVSVGGTLLDGSEGTSAAFNRADRALYRAKHARDATCILSHRSGGPAETGRRCCGGETTVVKGPGRGAVPV